MSLSAIRTSNMRVVAINPETGAEMARIVLVPPSLAVPQHQYPYQGRTVEEVTIPAGCVLQMVHEQDDFNAT